MKADGDQVSSKSSPDVVGAATIRGRVRRDRGDLDGRSAIAKRTLRLINRFVGALGGAARVSPVQMLAIRRAAELTVTTEQMRASALRGEPVDVLALVRLENLATRAVAALGLDQRQPEPKPPETFADLAARAQAAADVRRARELAEDGDDE